jgi:uncharacterized protein YkwD
MKMRKDLTKSESQATRRSSILVAVLVASLFLPRIGVAQQRTTNAEHVLFDSANRERVAQGLPPLKWDGALALAAQRHAQRMAQQGALSHQFPGEPDLPARATQAGSRFSTIAENVAEGPSAAGIHLQWMNSPPHRGNLLDPDLDSVGIAVVQRNGQFFAAEDFSRAVADLSLAEQERQVRALLEARGLRLLGNPADARQTCALVRGYAGKMRPQSVVRFETSDVRDVPDDLQQRIRSGDYHSAAVGACQSGSSSGFARYRFAVLLY